MRHSSGRKKLIGTRDSTDSFFSHTLKYKEEATRLLAARDQILKLLRAPKPDLAESPQFAPWRISMSKTLSQL